MHPHPTRDTSRFGNFRDNLARKIANFALNYIATPWYRAMIGGTIRYGLEAARKDSTNE